MKISLENYLRNKIDEVESRVFLLSLLKMIGGVVIAANALQC